MFHLDYSFPNISLDFFKKNVKACLRFNNLNQIFTRFLSKKDKTTSKHRAEEDNLNIFRVQKIICVLLEFIKGNKSE